MNSRIDLPLSGYTEDEPLGLAPYARALATFVKTCETPLTIGIQGDWGIGKTSLLNMVRDRLGTPDSNRDHREHLTVYFNTWQYAQLDGESHLIIALLGDLVRRIGALPGAGADSRDQAKSLLAKVGRMAASVGTQALLNKVGVDAGEVMRAGSDEDDLEAALPAALRMVRLVTEYRDEFERLVKTLIDAKEPGSRLVVMIDDLDRIRPARALELLSAIKNFLDVRGCVFLLAVDYEVIQRGVAETMGTGERRRHGKSYFDKIIQVPFNMPVASYRVDSYVMSLLGWTWDSSVKYYKKLDGADDRLLFKSQRAVGADVAVDLKNLTALTVGQNPRAIKRAANYFALLKLVFDENGGQELVTGRQDLYLRLLYAMACFHLAYPELFTLFVQEPTPSQLRRLEDVDVLAALPQMRLVAERVADAEETKSQISGFFDQLVAIVDTDGSGDISAAEFRPVLDVLKYSRLTSATIQEAEDGFAQIRSRVLHFASHWETPSKKEHLGRAIDVLQRSNLNDPLRLRIREAGARFFNLTWEGRLLGSVASAKGDPLQVYLKDEGGLQERLSERAAPFVTEVGHGHYGVGSLRLNLWDLAKQDDAVGLVNDCLGAALGTSSPPSSP